MLRGGYRGTTGDGRDLTWGTEHTVQCTDDVLQGCAPETCTILVTAITPMKKEEKPPNNVHINFTNNLRPTILASFFFLSLVAGQIGIHIHIYGIQEGEFPHYTVITSRDSRPLCFMIVS